MANMLFTKTWKQVIANWVQANRDTEQASELVNLYPAFGTLIPKSETRRLIHEDDTYEDADGDYPSGVFRWNTNGDGTSRPIYVCGKQYPVMPARGVKGVRAVAVVQLTDIKDVWAHEISDKSVRYEGFENKAEFLSVWRSMHGSNYEAWRIMFTVRSVNTDAVRTALAWEQEHQST